MEPSLTPMPVRRPEMALSARAILSAYEPGFRRSLGVRPEEADSPAALLQAVEQLDPAALDLLDTLLLGVGPGEAVPERLRKSIDAVGQELWRCAVLLPRTTPSPGSTIDPRYYASSCRVNPAMTLRRPLRELSSPVEESPGDPPPADARWDAIVVAAALELDPPRVTRQGQLRKDDEKRLLDRIGPDTGRWSLALTLAQLCGLARSAAGSLHGYPENRPRPLADPSPLFEDENIAAAGQVLLRLVGRGWMELGAILDHLEQHCPELLCARSGAPWSDRERPWFMRAADILHRVGLIDARRSFDGVKAIRKALRLPIRGGGFIVTPDREVLVAPGELSGPEYGRLCRLARYVDGDVVHRHRLHREGLASDLSAGRDDVVEWLGERARYGLPGTVRSAIQEWTLVASRVTLWTGVSLIEEEPGRFRRLTGPAPAARQIDYDALPPSTFSIQSGVLSLRWGQDALTLRALLGRLGPALPPDESGLRWTLRPPPVPNAEALLDQLRRYCEGELPGEIEAAVHAAAGRAKWSMSPVLLVQLPAEQMAALRRDRVAGEILRLSLDEERAVVSPAELDRLKQRLQDLGLEPPEGQGW
jgi:hypothetical protein